LSLPRLRPSLLPTLLELASRGASKGTVVTSTTELGRALGISQQAVSQHLNELEKLRLIERRHVGRKTGVVLTPDGLAHLMELLARLQRSVNMYPAQISLEGTVVPGVGEGAYYTRLEGYRQQFIKVLGIDPYPGTLNVKLASQADIVKRKQLEYMPGLRISGWKDEMRTYGGLTCFPAVVNSSLEAYLCLIDRTTHDESIVELISEKGIMKTLGLKFGDPVTITVRIGQPP
jgi:riboflavin kinase